MYSISSQLFEGLTEYIVQSAGTHERAEEQQKGPIGSGKVLADIIGKDTNQTEKKFLHDFSYNLFEDTLIKENRVLEIDTKNIDTNIDRIEDFSFVKISGNLLFKDYKFLEDAIKNFNKIGEALGYITEKASIDAELNKLKESVNNVKDRNQKAKLNAMLSSKTDFKKILIEKGLNMEEDYIKHLSYTIAYGYNQQFEVQIPIKSTSEKFHLFSAPMKRENLKDDEYSIMKKFSRETEKEFKLFGILTQRLTKEAKAKVFDNLKLEPGTSSEKSMKEALMNIFSALSNIENTFTDKLDYEFVIDPVALYLEI